MEIFIYVLKDEFDIIRYVGQTNNIKRRFNDHISYSFNINNKCYNTYKCRWIRKMIIDKNIKPSIEVIETIYFEDVIDIFTIRKYSLDRENYYIKKFTDDGIILTNSSFNDFTIFSEETLKKMSMAKKGKKLEEIVGLEKSIILRKNLSIRMLGNNYNKSYCLDVRNKISNTLKEYFKDKNKHWAYGKEMSDEFRYNLRKSHLNNPKNKGNTKKRTDEEKRKISEKISGTKIIISKIYQYDLNGKLIKIWNSIREICRETLYNRNNFSLNINKGRTFDKFKWVKEINLPKN